jgi:hypothetical protein
VALVTPTVKLAGPVPVGAPLKVPPGLSDSPGGSAPAVTLNVNGPALPDAVSVWKYVAPPVAFGSCDGDTARTAGTTENVYAREPLPAALVAVIVKFEELIVVVVPNNTPTFVSENPTGRLPAMTANENGPAVPVAVIACE